MAGNPNAKIRTANEGLTARHKNGMLDWTGKVRLLPERLDQPKRWSQPRRIFVNSLSDLFHEELSDADIDRVFRVMAACPQHIFQVLTKRPERMQKYVGDRWVQGKEGIWGPLPNVWLGTSVENQATAEERIPYLLDTPAAIRFLSCEPLLGPINLEVPRGLMRPGDTIYPPWFTQSGISWVIDGGESGPRFRPADADWFRSLRDQCVRSRIAYFHKQGSGRRSGQNVELDGVVWHQFPEVPA